MNMPRRPRAHQLEDLSLREFQRTIPLRWVCRELTRDYGIDLHVEIFDEDDLATGRSFFTQLKATDVRDLGAALAVRLPVEKVAYYASVDLPVLIVLYHAAGNDFYTRWFHEFDVKYSSTAQSTTYRLKLEDRWDDSSASEIERKVAAFRVLTRPNLPLPLPFSIGTAPNCDPGPVARIEIALRSVAENASTFVTIAPKPAAGGDYQFILAADHLTVDLAGVAKVTLQFDDHYADREDAYQRIATDAMVGLALALGQLGHWNAAARLASKFASGSDVPVDPGAAARLAGFFARSHRVVDALALGDRLRDRGEEFLFAAEVMTMPALTEFSDLDGDEQDEVEAYLTRRFESSLGSERRGVAAYNLANFYRTAQRPLDAVLFYKRAAKSHAYYYDVDYYHRELGGAYFESGEFGEATKHYRIALSLGSGGLTLALLADALLFCGRYAEAREAFEEARQLGWLPAEFRLKLWALSWITDFRTTDFQRRDIARGID